VFSSLEGQAFLADAQSLSANLGSSSTLTWAGYGGKDKKSKSDR
jgi:hypothetical protein